MRRLILVAPLLLAACVHVQLTPEAQLVRVTSNPEAVRGCKLIGPIEASDKMNGGMVGQVAAEENANRSLRNDAAKAGANTVLLASSTTGMSGARVRGEAYQCTATP